jgi:hypothetical protein
VLDVVSRGTYEREFIDDSEKCEYFVPIRWAQTVPIENAVQEIGMFGRFRHDSTGVFFRVKTWLRGACAVQAKSEDSVVLLAPFVIIFT